MTPAALIAFVVCFALGPLICAALMQLRPTLLALVALSAAIVAATLAALRLQATGAVLPSLGALWLAWVLAVSMTAVSLRNQIAAPRPRRWVTMGAILATTLPWFGLAMADMMV